ncbi:MAG: hypothetical protein Q9227_008332 [Pyrenula ochraceoflavens]
MGDIYANSYLTLAATTSPNSIGGLLHRRSPLSVWPCKVHATWKCFESGKLAISVGEWARERDMKPLEDRAWAFQEWLLSKRLVHFAHDQVRWECYCLAASEVYPEGLDDEDLDFLGIPTKGIVAYLSDDHSDIDALWKRIREEYSEKRLTKATDRLAAFSGIARMVLKVLKSSPEDYLVGLWKPKLLDELLWVRISDEQQPDENAAYIAPSWSWASLNGPFGRASHDATVQSESSKVHVSVLQSEVVPIDDVLGPVSNARLGMKCTLCSVTLTPREDADQKRAFGYYDWNVSSINSRSVNLKSWVSLDRHPTVCPNSSCGIAYFFIAFRTSLHEKTGQTSEVIGLLLSPTRESRGQYHRKGLLTVFMNQGDTNIFFSSLEAQNQSNKEWYLEGQNNDTCAIEIV